MARNLRQKNEVKRTITKRIVKFLFMNDETGEVIEEVETFFGVVKKKEVLASHPDLRYIGIASIYEYKYECTMELPDFFKHSDKIVLEDGLKSGTCLEFKDIYY